MIWTIPPELPFLDALAAGMLAETGGDPVALSRATVLLPTRRACRALREAFLRRSPRKAMLLPRLRAVGGIDDDEAGLGEDVDLPPAIPELRRRLLLAQLVAKAHVLLPGQAAALAAALARFLDEVQNEGGRLDLARLEALAPAEYAEHWQEVLAFLKILVEHWPLVLQDEGALDPATRRNEGLAALAEAWRRSPPAERIIAAGVTGALPAVAELLDVVARLPQGAIVLPGLDPMLGAAERADETHPQHGMAMLLDRLDVAPAEIRLWPAPGIESGPEPRVRLVREAMRPAATTDAWREGALPEGALAGMSRIDCPTPQDEALAVALLLRQQLELKGKTASLVTPDRDLARRVAAELRRWEIEIDDSAGVPLARTPPGAFLRLLVEAARELAPVPLLSLLKHPLASGGMATPRFRALVRRLERRALRGPRPAAGFAGLLGAVREDFRLTRFVEALSTILSPLAQALAAPAIALDRLVAIHADVAERLAATDGTAGPARLWDKDDGEAAARFVAELAEAARGLPAIRGEDWPALFEALLAGPVVRPRFGRHPRLAILGLMEARLLHADLVVLGGMNERTFPGEPPADPWMSRPMRRDLGLAAPERRIGEQAHDFVQLLGAPEVVLTRAQRVDGTPTVPSRWLQRLDAVLEAGGVAGGLPSPGGVSFLGWSALLDRPDGYRPVERPRPTPPLAARPTKLSVTQIQKWLADPYAIFARHVLGLKPIEPIDDDPGAGERGSFMHAALDTFVKRHPDALPADAADEIAAIGRECLGALYDRPGIWAFWWPRFERVAAWFLEAERERRKAVAGTVTEIKGEMTVDGFTLTCKADRLDRLRDGSLVIIDYKTGKVPKKAEVEAGRAPQLALEAAIAEQGGFPDLPAAPVGALEYWHVPGLRIAGDICSRAETAAEVRALVDAAVSGLRALVARFGDPATPYIALARLGGGRIYGDYLHLARVKEWMPGLETGG